MENEILTESKKQYIYIIQAPRETDTCKVGLSNDPEHRIKDLNNRTGKSQSNQFEPLFICEVADMLQVENDFKEKFSTHRPIKRKEIFVFTNDFFEDYVKFLKEHPLFIKEVFIVKDDTKVVKLVKISTPSRKDRAITDNTTLNQAKKAKYDEFYTRYEDVEKELSMYEINI